MAAGLRGQGGKLVLKHVGQGLNKELVRVTIQRLQMEVPVVLALQLKRKHVEQILVQVSVHSKECLSVLFCSKPIPLCVMQVLSNIAQSRITSKINVYVPQMKML